MLWRMDIFTGFIRSSLRRWRKNGDTAVYCIYICRSFPERWPNKPIKMSVRLYMCPSVRTSTMKHHADTNQIVIFVKVDGTCTTIWLSMSSEVRVKVTWDLKFQNWRFSNSISSTIFNQSKKSNGFWYYTKISKNSRVRFLNFILVTESCDFKLCQKSTKIFFPPILMKLGMMLEVDETFTTICLSRSSEVRVKVRRWPQSLLGLFLF